MKTINKALLIKDLRQISDSLRNGQEVNKDFLLSSIDDAIEIINSRLEAVTNKVDRIVKNTKKEMRGIKKKVTAVDFVKPAKAAVIYLDEYCNRGCDNVRLIKEGGAVYCPKCGWHYKKQSSGLWRK